MLQVGAEPFGLEGGPDGELQHGGGVAGPDGEAVGVEGELFLHGVDDLLVFVEEDLFCEVGWVSCAFGTMRF